MMYGIDEEQGSDYEDEDHEIFSQSFKPSYVVMAIDTHPCMFKKNEGENMPFRMFLESLDALMNTLLFRKDSRTWSPFAVVLSGMDTPLINFSQNFLDAIKLIKEKCKQTDADLIKEYQRQGDLNLSSFFLTCKKVFHEVKSVFYKRTLVYFSNDDKPVNNKNSRFTAFNEIKTFVASQIEFQVIPTTPDFKYNFFYNELFSIIGGPKREEICTDTEGLTQKMHSIIMLDINERKVLFYPFVGDNTRFLKCKRFSFSRNLQLFNSYVTKDGQKVINTPVFSDETPSFRIKFIGAGAEHVKFNSLEKDNMSDFTTPKGITLAYIGDSSAHSYGNPNLIRVDPTEELPYFARFWDHCAASNKVLVCVVKMKQPDKLKFVELVPVLVNGQQVFLEKRIPYGNEIVMPLKETYPEEETDNTRKEAIKALVDKMTFDFDPKMLQDIPLQKKKNFIKAKLLDEPLEPVNEVQVDNKMLDGVLEDVVTRIKEQFDLNETFDKKRKTPSNSQRNKRMK